MICAVGLFDVSCVVHVHSTYSDGTATVQWGNALHLFEKFWWYDNLVHITLPMSLAPILFGRHLLIGETDTVTDLADGFLGAGLGGLFLAAWALTRYTSRRLPHRLGRALVKDAT
jgi:hypothetical protein